MDDQPVDSEEWCAFLDDPDFWDGVYRRAKKIRGLVVADIDRMIREEGDGTEDGKM